MTTTLCIITKNEEHNIIRLLKSVEGLFDEICITDTGSTDKTVEVIKNYSPHVKLSHSQWRDDFSKARNFNFSQATGDFVCWMDADDIITPEQQKNLLKLIVDDLQNYDVVISSYVYRPGVLVPRERFIRRSLNLQWVGKCHEVIPFPPSLRILRTDFPFPTHMKSVADCIRNEKRNLKILQEAVKTDKSPRTLFYYANELMDTGSIDEAIEVYKEYLKTPDINEVGAIFRMVHSYGYERREEYVNACMLGILKSHGTFAEFPMALCELYFHEKKFQEAMHWASIASHLSPPRTDITVQTAYYGKVGHLPWLYLSLCYNAIGRVREAYEANEEALKFDRSQTLLNNREMFRNNLFPGRVNDRPVRLSLGSGLKFTPSYKRSDLHIGE